MAYQANGVLFGGTSDYLSIAGDLTGNANSKLLSFSFWFKRGTTGTSQRIYRSNGAGCHIEFATTNALSVRGENAAGTAILLVNSSAVTDTSGWHHVMGSFDLADTGKRHLYVDDASDLNVNTYTDDTIDFTQNGHGVGASDTGGGIYIGDLADVWIAFGQYIDLSIESNRRKFYGPNGGAVDLGSDGSTPTGTAPLIFCSGATSNWHTNKGTGGGFTENGALADAASDPPSEPDVSSLVLERGLGRGIQRGIMRGV